MCIFSDDCVNEGAGSEGLSSLIHRIEDSATSLAFKTEAFTETLREPHPFPNQLGEAVTRSLNRGVAKGLGFLRNVLRESGESLVRLAAELPSAGLEMEFDD